MALEMAPDPSVLRMADSQFFKGGIFSVGL
jgi:hypothetical protein